MKTKLSPLLMVMICACVLAGCRDRSDPLIDSASASNGFDSSWVPEWPALIAYWPLDGSEILANGDVVPATVGPTGTAMTSAGLSPVAGIVGNALQFDGTNDGVNVASSALLAPTSITLMAWVKANDLSNRVIIHKWASGSQYSIEVYSTHFLLAVNTTAGATAVSQTGTFPTGVWTHVAGTYDATTGKLAVYVNGVADNQLTATPGTMLSGTGTLVLGARSDSTSGRWNGLLSQLAIWGTALTDTQVKTIYDRQKAN